jgi:hypothetical protein
MKRRRKFHVQPTPELLRVVASREARRLGQYGWRPTQADLAQLRASTADPCAYRVMLRGWRGATGLKVQALKKLAGRGP